MGSIGINPGGTGGGGDHSPPGRTLRVAIQGEPGSNSHKAALEVMAARRWTFSIVACGLSVDVFEALAEASVDLAVLPIENSLHGSVAEHYDLLLLHDVEVMGELLLRVRHNVIAAPGVRLSDVRRVLSHPVALSQCRLWLRAHPQVEAVPFYDTAGSVKHVLESGLRDAAGIAPALAAEEYAGVILAAGIEDHAENYTRFLLLRKRGGRTPAADDPVALAANSNDGAPTPPTADKMSVAFRLEHRPGTLLGALAAFQDAGLNLTRIESRPVVGRPWEYVFFVDVRFEDPARVDAAVERLRGSCVMVRELGRYTAGSRE